MYTSAGVSTENAIERAKFIDAKPVYFPPMERKWGNDNLNGVAWKASAIHDKDGSSAVSPIPTSSFTTASSTASPPTRRRARSRRTGTLRCARATSDA
jgi:cell migration-inducing and hyaluronan-binding protein